MKMQSGFTLIELVLVIVIMGILAAVAVPQFIDLSSEAQQAATDSMAGALGSGAVMNFAKEKASATTGTAVGSCAAVATLMEGGSIPATYSITPTGTDIAGTDPEGKSVSCTLTGPDSTTATFRAIKVDPSS